MTKAHYIRLWHDAAALPVSRPQPNAQTLWQRLITGPEAGKVPGLIHAGRAALAEQLDWPAEAFDRCLSELVRAAALEHDWSARLVYVPHAVRYLPPDNPNQVRSWVRAICGMPECSLRRRAVVGLVAELVRLDNERAAAADEVRRPRPESLATPLRALLESEKQGTGVKVTVVRTVSATVPATVAPTVSDTPPPLPHGRRRADEWTEAVTDIVSSLQIAPTVRAERNPC